MNKNQICNLGDLLEILVDPESKESLTFNGNTLYNSKNSFNLIQESPILFPSPISKYLNNFVIDMTNKDQFTSIEQYFKILSIKMYMEINNLDANDYWYKQHLSWSKELVSTSQGLLLDIGCDDLEINLKVFPDNKIKYVGLEPIIKKKNYFSIYGVAEFLPFQSNSFDCVSFLTSLDHVLDYYSALKEAKRVLKKEGTLYLATLVWNKKSELYNDHHHFHHFKEFEIFGALNELDFNIEKLDRYAWKNDENRTALYIKAEKK